MTEPCTHRWITICDKCGKSKPFDKPTVSEVEGHKMDNVPQYPSKDNGYNRGVKKNFGIRFTKSF